MLVLFPLLFLSGLAAAQSALSTGTTHIVVTELGGPDPARYPVTETLYRWLTDIYAEYTDVEVSRSDETVAFDIRDVWTGAGDGYRIGTGTGADIVLWGSYLSGTDEMALCLVIQFPGRSDISSEGTLYPFYLEEGNGIDPGLLNSSSSPPDGILFLAYQTLGVLYGNRMEYDTALNLFLRAEPYGGAVMAEDRVTNYKGLAMIYWQQGRLEEALSSVESAIRLDEYDQQELFTLRMNILTGLGDPERRMDPGSAMPATAGECYTLAVLYDQIGDNQTAMTFYDAAMERATTDRRRSEILVDRALCLAYMGEFESAYGDAQLAIQYDPDNPMAQLRMGEACSDLDRFAEAIPYLTSAVTMLSNMPDLAAEALSTRSTCYRLTGDVRSALNDLEWIAGHGYADPQTMERLGVIYAETGDYQAAVQTLDGVLASGYESPAVYGYRGMCLAEMSSLDAAEADLQKAVDLDPTFAEAQYYLARVLATGQRYEEALVSMNAAVDSEVLPEGVAGYRLERAKLLAQMGDPEAALEDLDAVVAFFPDESAGYYYRALVWGLLGDNVRAREDLERSLEHAGDEESREMIQAELDALGE
jgi:tetratricopeptide (TPR) repeat protein